MSEKTENQKKRYKRSPALSASIILVFLSIVLLITLAMFTSFDEVTNRLEAGKVDIVLEEHHWKPSNGSEIVPNTFVEKDPSIRNKEETVNTYVFLEVIVPYDDDPNLIIEAAYQNGTDGTGNLAGIHIYNNATQKKVPLYKFVATGEQITKNSYKNYTKDGSLTGFYDDTYTSAQKVNEKRWYLLPGYPTDNAESRTFTYVYAYVQERNIPVDSNAIVQLEPLLAGRQTNIPLFNEIYLLNFREREEIKGTNGTVTQTPFPEPARDYSIKINAYGIQANFLRENNETTTNPQAVWKMLNPDYNYTETTP